MSYGRYFEELEVGQQFRHWPGRTIGEFDDTLFALLSFIADVGRPRFAYR